MTNRVEDDEHKVLHFSKRRDENKAFKRCRTVFLEHSGGKTPKAHCDTVRSIEKYRKRCQRQFEIQLSNTDGPAVLKTVGNFHGKGILN